MGRTQQICNCNSASRHQQTLDQAVMLFARRGYANVGLRELAEHVGIKAGSIYYHIESKEALLFELIEILHEDLLHVLDRALSVRFDPRKRLRQLVCDHLELHLGKGDYFRVFEQAINCLGVQHQECINGLRRSYEQKLFEILRPFGLAPDYILALTCVRSIADVLNHLPHRMVGIDLTSEFYARLMEGMILGAIIQGESQ